MTYSMLGLIWVCKVAGLIYLAYVQVTNAADGAYFLPDNI
jgi:hypothetical protein